ncbi:hypothetical protein C8F01DRAFT_1254165 [Mycena amicta]|nr:hypothetical protein C8F01DRAFT_1254165 [Mycena amicta]
MEKNASPIISSNDTVVPNGPSPDTSDASTPASGPDNGPNGRTASVVPNGASADTSMPAPGPDNAPNALPGVNPAAAATATLSQKKRVTVEEVEDEEDIARRKREEVSEGTANAPTEKRAKANPKAKKKVVPDDLPSDIPNEVGHRNWAKGICESQILEPGLAEYAQAVRSGNRAAVRAFIQKKTNQYIYQVGWRTSLKVEPESLPRWDETMILEDEEGLTPAEERAKAWIIDQTSNRIVRWYTYRHESTQGRGVKVGNPEDPYSVFLTELAGIAPVKKARQGFQQYMHESYATEIATVVNSRWESEPDKPATVSRAAPPWYRAKIARELFNALPDGQQKELKARAKTAAVQGRESYAQRVRESSERSPETIQRAIDGLAAAMHPLMQGISDATGLQFLLVGGGPMPRYGGEIRTIHMSIGQNNASVPTSFPKWKRTHFNTEILGSFKDYLETAYTPAQRSAVALPNHDPTTLPEDLLVMDDAENTPSAPSASSSQAVTSSASKRKATSVQASSSKTALSKDEDEDDDDDDDEGDDEEEEDRRRRCKFNDMRNTNIARNEALLDSLKIKEAMSGLFPAVKPPAQRKPRQTKAAATVPPRRSLRRAGKELDSEAMDVVTTDGERDGLIEGDGGEEPFGDEDSVFVDPGDEMLQSEPEMTLGPSADPGNDDAPSTGIRDDDVDMDIDSQPTSPIPACPDDAAEWVRSVYPEFTGENLGPRFNAVVQAFFEMQRAFGWINGSGTLPTEHRPKQIAAWVKNCRVAKPAYCSIPNKAIYSKQWWAWWTGMQPAWRGRTDDRKPGKGDADGQAWEGLYVSGVNGMVNVVVSLYWWGCKEKLGLGASAEWIEAAEDVEWVLSGIRATVEADMA